MSKQLKGISPFCLDTDTLGFKTSVDPPARALCRLHATGSSDSSLVRHLLSFILCNMEIQANFFYVNE